MKVLFDHQIYFRQKYGGISRYFYELSKGLTKLGAEAVNSIRLSDNDFCKDNTIFNLYNFPNVHFRGLPRFKNIINEWSSITKLKESDFDVFHPTYYETYYLNRSRLKKPFVLTFHDLIHEKFGNTYPEHLKGWKEEVERRKQLVKKASHIITVSENTKRDLVEYYNIAEQTISVIYLANSLVPLQVEKVADNGRKYILFVGNRDAYKNWHLFIRAVQPLLKREKDLSVISAGGGSFSPDEVAFLKSLGIENHVKYAAVNDGNLASLYQQAICFVFPSLYEGFGIPVLEAFNCNCPAILSNVSSLPEIGGNAALYINPEDEADIAAKVDAFISSQTLREEYIHRGTAQAARFSWDKMTKQTLDVYKNA